MPSLINTDNAGNVFLNYITPVIKGNAISLLSGSSTYRTLLETAYGAIGGYWSNETVSYNSSFAGAEGYQIRLPASTLEQKTSTPRFVFSPWLHSYHGDSGGKYTTAVKTWDFSNNDTPVVLTGNRALTAPQLSNPQNTHYPFWVINDYSIAVAIFSNTTLTTLAGFLYLGWLREPVYTDSNYMRGCVVIRNGFYNRATEGGTSGRTLLSSAADSITSPPIVCTPGTDPGDGSETATDIVIRDAAAPNNPVGKLWNCIDLPSSSVVGGLYKNTGNYDGDSSESEQDVYLCVMPWGTRKLGMRIWTENVV